jgi:hypothetical protein
MSLVLDISTPTDLPCVSCDSGARRLVPCASVRFAAALLIPFALLLASCGGGNDNQDPQTVLNRGFAHPVHSADMRLEATLTLNGSSSLKQPLRITATGPFEGHKGSLPSADLTLDVATGGGQTVETGFLSTGKRAFVKFQDVYYEQPAATVAKANQSLAGKKGNGRSLRSLGLDPRAWLGKAHDQGDETVAGAKTTHVQGTIDMKAMLT